MKSRKDGAVCSMPPSAGVWFQYTGAVGGKWFLASCIPGRSCSRLSGMIWELQWEEDGSGDGLVQQRGSEAHVRNGQAFRIWDLADKGQRKRRSVDDAESRNLAI